ncbi:MAG TPA: YjdF family protein [Pseudonocardiaceae bacterium]|jgi:hypothetical protein|nr:YjdF family protein [Pseudonocardiaceae bacterium]
MSGSFTVYYDGQFWIGLVEFRDTDGVRAARHVFGNEPNNAELLAFASGREFDQLARRAHAAPPVSDDQRPTQRINWKRLAKAAAKEQQEVGAGTAAQRALKEDLMRRLAETGAKHKEHREADAEHRRAIARAKAKAKHRGH